ncbi:MAG: ribose-phosphate pyrophosphokinase [Candidatus Peregrinibacteria bacterium]
MTSHLANARFFAGSGSPSLAEGIVQKLGTELSPLTIKKFSCGETYIKFGESMRGKDVFLIHTIRTGMVNEDFIELFLLCDAAKRSFARSVHVILPHFGYSRQDKIHDARETISAKLMADLLVTSGANHVVTIQLHSDQTQGFFDVAVDNLSMRKTFVQYFAKKQMPNTVVVSPDAGGAKMAKKFADELGAELAILHKSRPAHNVAEITEVVGEVAGKTCILVDDMIDTAGSVCAAKKALLKNGANPEVYLCATHPIFSGPAYERLKDAGFTEIVVSNSVPIPEEEREKNPAIHIIDTAPLLAHVIENILEERSVSKLFF